MSKKLYMTNADYVAIAISPALIMALVGSLVYFLIEVMYVGEYQARLNYAFGLFVFATVLIARISIEMGSERAVLFALALGISMFMFMVKFIEQPSAFSHVINLGLMCLVWWCAHRLTWDSTVIDDEEDASGEGLMQRIGVDESEAAASAGERQEAALAAERKQDDGARENELLADSQLPSSAAQRLWQAFVKPKKGPHTPGLWVLYFSLAALPLFGIGQHWIPASDVGRRRYAFGLLLVYVAAALSLLVTTSFLNLRRYLRQRRVEMPPLVAGTWVGLGVVMILIVMFLAALVPRPAAEIAMSRVPWQAGSPSGLSASRYAMNRDGGEKQNADQSATPGEKTDNQQTQGPAQTTPEANQQGTQPSSDGQPSGEGQQSQGQQAAGSQANSQGKSDSKQADSNSQQSGQQTAEAKQGEAGQSSASQQDRQPANEGNPKQGEAANQTQPQGQQQDANSAANQSESNKDGESSAAQQQSEQQSEQQAGQSGTTTSSPSTLNMLHNVTSSLGGLAGVLKTLLYVVVGLAILYGAWKYRQQIMQALAEIMAQLRALFGGKPAAQQAGEEAAAAQARRRTFAEFRDPFLSGEARQMAPDELVRYTFTAFEAWAGDRGQPRDVDCTPQELVRLAVPAEHRMNADAKRLARLYSEAAYAGARIPREAAGELRSLWQMMRDAHATEMAGVR
jgi:hypothetical protein